MHNPFRRPRQPDATAMHALQVARLQGELDAARLTIAALRADVERLERDCAVREIRRAYSNGEKTQVELAAYYKVHQSTINSIILGKTWRHVK